MGKTTEQLEQPDFQKFFKQQIHDRVSEAIRDDRDSVKVKLTDLDDYQTAVSHFVQENPEESLMCMEEDLQELDVVNRVLRVRLVKDKGEDKDFNADNIGELFNVEGSVEDYDVSGKKVTVDSATFECSGCGAKYSKKQNGTKLKSPYKCEDCGTRKFKVVEKKHRDYAEFEINCKDYGKVSGRAFGKDARLIHESQKITEFAGTAILNEENCQFRLDFTHLSN